MSTSKFAKKVYKKSPYGTAKHFTNAELLTIILKYRNDKSKDKKSWMSFDAKNETKNDKMEKNKVRYLQVLVTDLEGRERPLIRDVAASITQSKCKLSETEDGKIPSSASFSTRIRIMTEPGDEITEARARALLAPADDEEWRARVTEFGIGAKFTATEAFVDAVITVAAECVVSEKFPDISQDQYDITVKRQEELLKQQYVGWRVDKAIAAEFERLLNDKRVREGINWTKRADQKIAANVQYTRNARDGDADDAAILERLTAAAGREVEQIPLEEWMVYYRIRISTTDGSLWCKIYDQTVKLPKGQRKLATMKNPETGMVEVLNHRTIEAWLRYGSAYTGFVKYQLCISTVGGGRLHAAMSEMAARRGARGEGQSRIEEAAVNDLDDFGGNFGGEDEDPEPEQPQKKTTLSALERQMAALEADADDDE